MIRIEFLVRSEYKKYSNWLLSQSSATLTDCFGTPVDANFISELAEQIDESPGKHYFLVALDGSQWVGVLHITTVVNARVEFKIIVDPQYQGQGVAGRLMSEAVIWAKNHQYKHLYLSCLSRNQPIQHLCKKHGLEIRYHDGVVDAEVDLKLAVMS
jgi:RimJ/RimL family protein N-acetyltransferase